MFICVDFYVIQKYLRIFFSSHDTVFFLIGFSDISSTSPSVSPVLSPYLFSSYGRFRFCPTKVLDLDSLWSHRTQGFSEVSPIDLVVHVSRSVTPQTNVILGDKRVDISILSLWLVWSTNSLTNRRSGHFTFRVQFYTFTRKHYGRNEVTLQKD